MSSSMESYPTALADANVAAVAPAPGRTSANVTRTLLGAIELGILADLLLRAGGPGLNLTLWCWALLAAGMLAHGDVPVDRRRVTLLAAAAFFAAVPAWRSDEALVLASGLAVLVLLVLLTWTAALPATQLAARTIGAYIGAAWTAALCIIAGAAPLIVAEARTRTEVAAGYRHTAGAMLRGLVLAVPVVFIFATLLMQADAAYASLVHGLFRWDAETVISHVALTAVFAWLAAAYLGAPSHWARRAPAASLPFRLGAIEAGTIVALVDALFLSFVLVQARYLFGGVSHVVETLGLTYAEYARRGFFELVAVTALALPLLIAVTEGARIESRREKRVHGILSAVLIGLLLLMMASALSRMWIYQAEYGWTLLRVHATALMLWIGGTIVWFGACALRRTPGRFVIGSIGAGLAMLACLVVLNPAAGIITANAQRAHAGSDFDGADAAALGADGLPTLLAALPAIAARLDDQERCAIRRAIDRAVAEGTGEGSGRDWRTVSLSNVRAHKAVARYRAVADATLPSATQCATSR